MKVLDLFRKVLLFGLLLELAETGLVRALGFAVALLSGIRLQLGKRLLLLVDFVLIHLINDELFHLILLRKQTLFLDSLSVFYFLVLLLKLEALHGHTLPLDPLTRLEELNGFVRKPSLENLGDVEGLLHLPHINFENPLDFFLVLFEPIEVPELVSVGDEFQQGLEEILEKLVLRFLELVFQVFVHYLLLDFVDLESPVHHSISLTDYLLPSELQPDVLVLLELEFKPGRTPERGLLERHTRLLDSVGAVVPHDFEVIYFPFDGNQRVLHSLHHQNFIVRTRPVVNVVVLSLGIQLLAAGFVEVDEKQGH